VLYLVNGVQLLVYVVMQVILVANTLQDRWPLGDIAFGVFFFAIGQVILYTFSEKICENVQHYLDGLFFATVCNLLAVMMVYKVCHASSLRLLPSSPSSTSADISRLYSIGIP
jgi:Chitin synthase export chaperone